VSEVVFLEPLNMDILSERRVFAPYDLEGGESGKRGKNIFIHSDGRQLYLGAKNEILAQPGDRFCILTPGGGDSVKRKPDSSAIRFLRNFNWDQDSATFFISFK
jgi:5-oxoprolinase (ATP-hydrolysing)